ncbi:helix-turn-helix domain-containing protein [Streptomyces yaanensis]|uniref:Helix-turn-helix domain-containing protein n=1 Tax=Streptomyces yaanensis TaxID=1142239 RepID=A0ABV7SAY0_9ACTN|nr:helix-turn-helix transcriptional regulator [Streptomyces sp. CGMCC 4.7035]WNC02463.1 helix-turn-helix transcriptional regulator [Streptomyces sp. CGMCC 4.7035]
MSTGDDVEQFAVLLRRLKDRTDRSYGSLARRLNMNTSTLHRYCAGEAVPQDYAPVERLAAFCGATPEERHELHRLWLLAVTARQRPRAREGAAEPATAEEAAEPTNAKGVPEPAGGRRASGPDSRTALGTGSSADGIGGDGSGRSGAPRRLEASTSDAGASDAGLPASDPPVPGGPEPTIQWDAARSTGRPWYRRRRTVVGAAAATVLLATLGSLSALSADRSHDSSAKVAGQSRTAGTSTSPHPSAAATSASPSRSSASPSAGVRASGSPKPKGGPSADAKSDAPAPTGVPLAWTADSQIWDGGCGHDYVIQKEPAQVPPPPVEQDAGVWAATQEAVPGRQTMVQISVQGKSSTAVVLEALRVRIVSRGTPVTGNAYAMGQGCGGDLTPRDFSVNLDVNRPIAHARAVEFPYRVSAEDPEVLLVTATTETYDCKWYLELAWSSQGRTGTVRIDDHGRPFRTSGIKGLPHYWYGTNGHGVRQWVPAD